MNSKQILDTLNAIREGKKNSAEFERGICTAIDLVEAEEYRPEGAGSEWCVCDSDSVLTKLRNMLDE